MWIKNIKITFVFAILILLLGSTTNVFAAPIVSMDNNVHTLLDGEVYTLGDHLKMTGKDTATFQYQIIGKDGTDITSKVPASDISGVDAIVGWNYLTGGGGRAAVSLDPSTGTCTLKYNFSDSDTDVRVTFMYNGSMCDQSYYIGDLDPEHSKVIGEIDFLSSYFTNVGTNAFTFKYKISSDVGVDITKEIPASQIVASSSVDSSIVLDPASGTGTITFNSTDTDKIITTTLRDKLTGKTGILNTSGLGEDQVKRVDSSVVTRINFVSSDLIKTGTDTATFNYKILDHYYKDITGTIPKTDINANVLIGSSKGEISLDPLTGTGTIKYNFSDADKKATITLMYKTGVEASSTLNIVSSVPGADNDDNDDLEIGQIVFISTDVTNNPSWSELKYKILNIYGKDITGKIPASQIEVSSSVNSEIALVPLMGTCEIVYNSYDSDRTIIVSLCDEITGVKAALNIGNEPTSSPSGTTDATVVTFKDPVLEQAIRSIIHKPAGDIFESDVKNITYLTIPSGCTDLSGIENLTSLYSIDLYTDKISDLSPLKEMPNLKSLVCRGDSIGDIKTLEELTNLVSLDISTSKISDDDLASIKKALPNCYVNQIK